MIVDELTEVFERRKRNLRVWIDYALMNYKLHGS